VLPPYGALLIEANVRCVQATMVGAGSAYRGESLISARLKLK